MGTKTTRKLWYKYNFLRIECLVFCSHESHKTSCTLREQEVKHDNLEKLSVINALDLRTTSSPLTTHLFVGPTRQLGIPTFRAQAWWPDESSSWDRTLTPVVPVNWPGSCLLRAQFCIWIGKGHKSYKSLMLHTLLSFSHEAKNYLRIF